MCTAVPGAFIAAQGGRGRKGARQRRRCGRASAVPPDSRPSAASTRAPARSAPPAARQHGTPGAPRCDGAATTLRRVAAVLQHCVATNCTALQQRCNTALHRPGLSTLWVQGCSGRMPTQRLRTDGVGTEGKWECSVYWGRIRALSATWRQSGYSGFAQGTHRAVVGDEAVQLPLVDLAVMPLVERSKHLRVRARAWARGWVCACVCAQSEGCAR
jgi:hypothetical protein